MRIIARLNVGGPARHVVILDGGLARRGFATLLVHGDVGPGEAAMDRLVLDAGVPSCRVATLGRRVSPVDDVRALVSLVRLMRRFRPDVVHTHTAKAGTLGRLAAGIYNVLRRPRGRALVVHTFHGHVLHGYFGPLGSAVVRWIERALAGITDQVIVLSPRLRDDIVVRHRVAAASKVHIVPLGLEIEPLLRLERADERHHLAGGATVFGYVGRLVPIKNVPLLVDAFGRVRARIPDTRLLIVGDGELGESLRAMVASRDLGAAVQFVGWQSDLASVYAGMDVLVLASDNEGTPVAAIEAMAAGLPVVATAVGGVPDVVTDGETGLLVPPQDVNAMVAALQRLALDPSERRRLGTAARAAVAARHSTERLVGDVESLYRTALSDRRRSYSINH